MVGHAHPHPDDFGFRTGGARSIRGYRYLSLGAAPEQRHRGRARDGGGSVEYDHYFNDRWGVGLFVDAGDAAESFGDMDLGRGLRRGRARADPAGPCSWTSAYGAARERPAPALLAGDRVFERAAQALRAVLRLILVWLLPGLATLASLAVALLLWLGGTQSGTRLLLATAAQQFDGQVEGGRGSALRGLRVDHLKLAFGETGIEIDDFALDVDWRALRGRQLHVRELAAGQLRVSLGLPAPMRRTSPASPSRCRCPCRWIASLSASSG